MSTQPNAWICNTAPCVNVTVAAVDWQTHLTTDHATNSAAADASKVAAGGGSSSAAPNPIVTALGTRSLMSELQLDPATFFDEQALTIGGGSVAGVKELSLLKATAEKMAGINSADDAALMMTICVHGFECDFGEESFLKGSFKIKESASPTYYGPYTWESFWKTFNTLFMSLSGMKASPRYIGKGLAPIIWTGLNAGKGPLAAFHNTKPGWALKYSSTSAWYAASSIFPYMKESSEWSLEERSTYEAHTTSVTKVANEFSSAIFKNTIDQGGFAAGNSAKQMIAQQFVEAVRGRNIDEARKLRSIGLPGWTQP